MQSHVLYPAMLEVLIDQALAVYLHQSQAQDYDTFCREAAVRAPFGADGGLPFTDARAAWKPWIERIFDERSELAGRVEEAPKPHTICVLPGTTVHDILDGDPANTGVCLPHAVTAASGGGRQAALARHRGDGEEQKRIEAVYARLQRSGATHLAACQWSASKPPTRAAEGAAEPPAAAAVAPRRVAEVPPHNAAAAAASSVAEQPPHDAAAAAASSVAEQPPPRSGGGSKKKGKARKRVAHVTVDTNVMD